MHKKEDLYYGGVYKLSNFSKWPFWKNMLPNLITTMRNAFKQHLFKLLKSNTQASIWHSFLVKIQIFPIFKFPLDILPSGSVWKTKSFFFMNNPYTHCVSGCKRKHRNVLWSYLSLWHRIGIDLQQTRRHLELHDSQSCFLKTYSIYFRNKTILKVA